MTAQEKIKNSSNRAKNNLKKAFIYLIKKKGYSSITIKDIVEKAEYSRGSFYKYYLDKEDMAHEISNDIIEGYVGVCRDIFKEGSTLYFKNVNTVKTYKIFEYIKENVDRFDLFGIEDTIPGLKSRLIEAIRLMLRDEMSFYTDKREEHKSDYIINFRAYGTYGVLIQWISNNYSDSPQFIADEIFKLYGTSVSLVRSKN